MLKQNWRFISRVERLGDLLIVGMAFLSAYYGRSSLLFWNEVLQLGIPFAGDALLPIKDYFLVLLVGLLSYGTLLQLLGAYNSMRLSSVWRLLKVSLLSSLLTFVALASTLYALKVEVSRSFLGLFCLFSAAFILMERYAVLKLLRYWRRKGRNFRNLLFCGVGEQALKLSQEILHRPELGLGIKGFCILGAPDKEEESLRKLRVMWTMDGRGPFPSIARGLPAALEVLETAAIDEVIFTDFIESMSEVEELVQRCSEQGVRTTLAADLFSFGMVTSEMSYFGGMPLIHFQTPPGDRWELALKRGIDVAVSFLLLLLLSPLFLVVAIGIKFSSPGPILFKQKRVGLHGRLFSLYKFRSMYEGAEELRDQLAALNEMKGPVFKLTKDPRITSLGRILRRFSLDELPQLWNVFRGDMSLVGPRPPIPGEVKLYERRERRRLSMRPGLTCIWQVSGRNKISDFEAWVKLDLEYIDNWSLGRDFLLLLRTIPVVVFGIGAR